MAKMQSKTKQIRAKQEVVQMFGTNQPSLFSAERFPDTFDFDPEAILTASMETGKAVDDAKLVLGAHTTTIIQP